MKRRSYFQELIHARRLSMENEYLKERLRRQAEHRDK